MLDLPAALKQAFGFDSFRPYQEEVVRRVMAGTDTLAVLPTGAGKSLCYQLPALLLPHPTLVISPLIALMKDQLDSLPPDLRECSTVINSALAPEEAEERLAGMDERRYKLIYASPERLRQQGFLNRLARMGLSLVVVDEAHCVSVWGHDFRPDYLFIRRALAALSEGTERPALLAVTATATPEMQAEIGAQLGRALDPVVAPIYRPNLRLEVFPCANVADKLKRLTAVCAETPGATIVYVNSRDRCEEIAKYLRGERIPAAHYHAGMDRDERRLTQERFMLGKVRVMVATVAFGMGVDKSNIRLVVHFSLPRSLESYAQESGRAGRDGRPSRCVILHSSADRSNLQRWMRQEAVDLPTVRDVYRALQARLGKGSGPVEPDWLTQAAFGDQTEPGDEVRMRVSVSVLERCGLLVRHPDAGRDMHIEMLPTGKEARGRIDALLEARQAHGERRLREMLGYVEARTCRHAVISAYFGQSQEPCGAACDVCLGTAEEAPPDKVEPPSAEEVPDVGRVILEALTALPFSMGRTGLAKVLVGAPDSAVKRDRCPHFGRLEGMARGAVGKMIAEVTDMGMLEPFTVNDYPVLRPTRLGFDALASDVMILANPVVPKGVRYRGPAKLAVAPAVPATEEESDRYEKLRAWRRFEAQRRSLPPYVIFHDTVLQTIACHDPHTLSELETLPGIGPAKLEAYGQSILNVLRGED